MEVIWEQLLIRWIRRNVGWDRFLILLIGDSAPPPTTPIDVIWEGFILEKVGVKTRDIQFYSEKGGAIIKVHSKPARDYEELGRTAGGYGLLLV